MLESQKHHHEAKNPINSFSFMRTISDFIATLTSDEVERSTTKDGMIHFRKEKGAASIVHPSNTGGASHPNSVKLHASTVERRSGAFEESGTLAHLKPLIYNQGRIDRRFLIQEISIGKTTKTNLDHCDEHAIASKITTTGSRLRKAKNDFKESDSVNDIHELSTWDLMYIRFVDDSHVYAISVKDSSRIVGGKGTALCNITYEEDGEEITQEGIIRLPLQLDSQMFVTTGGKKILSLNKTISNMKVRKKGRPMLH